jgi:hypothetical protein
VINRTTQSALLVAGAAVGVAAAAWLGKRRLASVTAEPRLVPPDRLEPVRASLARRSTGPEPRRAAPQSSVAELVGAESVALPAGPGGEFGIDEASSRTMRRQDAIPRSELVEPDRAELPLGRSADPNIDEALSRTSLPQDSTSGGALLGEEEPFAGDAPTDGSLDEVWNSLPGIAEGEQSEGYDAVAPEDLGSVWLERATQTTREDRPHGSDPNDVPNLDDLLVSEATLTTSQQGDEEVDEDEADEDDEDEIAEDELDER